MRTDQTYEKIHEKISEFANQVDVSLDPPSSKRKKNLPSKLKDYVADSTVGAKEGINTPNVVDYWRAHVFYRILHSLVGFLKSRFSEESLRIAAAIDKFFTLDYEGSMPFIEYYAEYFRLEKNILKAEMTVLRNSLANGKKDASYETLRNELKPEIFPSVYTLFQVAITLPVTSATCERSFSIMRIILNWLRLSMDKERFSALGLLFIEKDIEINLEDVIDKYASKNRKINLVY